MTEKVIDIRIHVPSIKLSRGFYRWSLVACLLFTLVYPTSTESVTLTTYYPAPAGVYNNMVTIGNTWLARDNVPSTGQPSFVELGSNAPVSAGTKLAVMNGNVGIGTTSPTSILTIDPGGYGNLTVGNPNTAAGGYTGILMGISAESNGYGWIQAIRASGTLLGDIILNQYGGNVGIGTTNPQYTLDVNGTFGIRTLILPFNTCSNVGYSAGISYCPTGQYATYLSGVAMVDMYESLPQITGVLGEQLGDVLIQCYDTQDGSSGWCSFSENNGNMYCCNP